TTFVVLNKGKKAHALMVKGPGVKGAHTAKVAAGGSAKLTVTLKAGAYVLSDPIGLGEYNVLFLDVIKSTSLTAKGDGSVVAPPVDPPRCAASTTPRNAGSRYERGREADHLSVRSIASAGEDAVVRDV